MKLLNLGVGTGLTSEAIKGMDNMAAVFSDEEGEATKLLGWGIGFFLLPPFSLSLERDTFNLGFGTGSAKIIFEIGKKS